MITVYDQHIGNKVKSRKFNIGDWVITKQEDIGVITNIHIFIYYVDFNKGGSGSWYYQDELKLIPSPKFNIGDKVEYRNKTFVYIIEERKYDKKDEEWVYKNRYLAFRELRLKLCDEEKEKEMKYKLLKIINIGPLLRAQGDIECEEFDREFVKLTKYMIENHNPECITQNIWDKTFYPYFKDKPNCLEWLEEKGFIEKIEEEVFYKTGDRFIEKEYGEFILAKVDYNKMVLICIEKGSADSGDRYTNPVTVANINKVTQEEFKKMCGVTGKFTKIEK